MRSVPTEDEIRDAAQRLGLVDENGNYRQRDRSRIAAAILAAEQEEAEAADPMQGTTAEVLGRFGSELAAAGVIGDSCARVLAVAATHLLRTAGLNLNNGETTP